MLTKIEQAKYFHRNFKFEESLKICNEILEKDPKNIYALSIVAACHLDKGDYEKAVPMLTHLINVNPDDIVSITNLSSAMREVSYIDESEKLAMIAYDKEPKNPLTLQNLGQFYTVTGKHQEAKNIYTYLCYIDTKNVLGHLALGNCLLLEGETDAGLRELETGNILHELEDLNNEPIPGMAWNGMKMKNGKLLVILNQGFGDSIQHSSRIKSAAEKCDRGVIICGQPEILPLFKYIDGVVSVVENGGITEGYSAYCRITSLASLGCEVEPSGYIKNVVPSYQKRSRPLVGLSWRGRPVPRARSIPLEFLKAELSNLDVDFVSLQHDTTAEEFQLFPMMVNPVIENLEDIAKVIASCDIIIGIDSAMIHLAGAMKKTGLVLLSCHWDYRWGLNKTGPSPLYPTINMTRQEKMGDWTVPIMSAREYIENFIRT